MTPSKKARPGRRAVEDPRVGDLELAEGELVAVAGGTVGRREGRRQAGLPAGEEALHGTRPQAVADALEGGRVVARAEAVVEGDIADAGG